MKQTTTLLLLALVMVTACHQSPNYKSNEFADLSMEEEVIPITRQVSVPPPPPPSLQTPEVVKKKIIKDGRMGMKVRNLEQTKDRVDSLVKSLDGYYSNESLNNSDWESSYNLTVRIPAAGFETFILALESGNGEILYKEVDARDVTDQFIDLETRLKNKRAYLQRYNDLLKKARNVKEILEIQEKIRRLEEEVESTTGRLKYLGDQVKYSTLRLNILKQKDFKYTPNKRDKFSESIKQSLSKGWFGFVDFIIWVVKLWPFWIIAGLIIYVFKRIRRKRKANKPGKK
ncbi:MAG: DUF4349 domain-containing protein [Carboxylicivirga sp.]|jgi:hypothetical protein|nr:DUF4349 domain-containing protein [Carboxylicivirga sp.]